MALESIGLSGLLTSQRLIDLTGQNITNANTAGYHRRVARLAVRTTGQETAMGVEITNISRTLDQSLEQAVTRSTFAFHDLDAQLGVLRQIEVELNPGTGSVADLLERFFNQSEELAGHPDDLTRRRAVIQTANSLTERLNSLFNNLETLRANLSERLERGVNEVNRLTTNIAQLNAAIQKNTVQGVNAEDLSDRRDQLINELAQWIDVRVLTLEHGSVNVLAAGLPVVLGSQKIDLQMSLDGEGNTVLAAAGVPASLNVTGGQLRGLLEMRNQTTRSVQDSLNEFALSLVRTIDGVQATGLGFGGPFNELRSLRAVNNANVPLSQAGLAIPPKAGTLSVSVTDLATGQRSMTQIAIDPATQSLQDLASALSSIPHLQAIIDPQTNALTIVAAPGFAFDFAGRLSTTPDSTTLSGTSTPQLGVAYTGTSNEQFTFKVVGSGTVGVTPGLSLEVRNAANQVVATWNIGQGYQPNTDLPTLQGVRLQLGSGTVNDGQAFVVHAVVDPDTADILPALGLNGFFRGEELGKLSVREDLLAESGRLATSRTGFPADGTNWQRLADARDQALLSGGTRTFRSFYAELAANVGAQVQDVQQRHAAEESLGRSLEAERQGVSGVDTNEELMRLVQYQRAFQLSGRFLNIVNELMDELLRLA